MTGLPSAGRASTTSGTRTRAGWLEFFRGHDVCLTPVNSPADALGDPHIATRGKVVSGPALRAILPPFVSDAPALRPAPALGADTDEVIGSLRS